jgi:hypothetical protein
LDNPGSLILLCMLFTNSVTLWVSVSYYQSRDKIIIMIIIMVVPSTYIALRAWYSNHLAYINSLNIHIHIISHKIYFLISTSNSDHTGFLWQLDKYIKWLLQCWGQTHWALLKFRCWVLQVKARKSWSQRECSDLWKWRSTKDKFSQLSQPSLELIMATTSHSFLFLHTCNLNFPPTPQCHF